LLREEEGLAARVLSILDVPIDEVRARVEEIIGRGEYAASGQMPLTPRAKKVLELALREALSLGHNYIGTEHVLLGLIRENEGVASRILLEFDADPEKVRSMIVEMLSGLGRRGLDPVEPPRPGGGAPRPRRWRYQLESWPAGGTDLRSMLDTLGAQGWELTTSVPTEIGSDLVFRRPVLPGETAGMPVGFDTVRLGSTVVEVSRTLAIPLPSVIGTLQMVGHPKTATQELSELEIQLLARAFGRVILVARSDEPPPDPD
jgi:hypothetical protein